MSANQLQKMEIFKYITEDNAEYYRAIMRFFHGKYQKFDHFNTTVDDVYRFLKERKLLEEKHTPHMVESWLRRLEMLEAVQSQRDKKSGNSIKEYLQTRSLYQITDLGVEIEELLIRIENLDDALLSQLDSRDFARLKHFLTKFKEADPLRLKQEEISDMWNNVLNTHKKIKDSASSYLMHIQKAEQTNLFDSILFVEFKDTFMKFLVHYITELDYNKKAICSIVEEVPGGHVQDYIMELLKMNRVNMFFNQDYDEVNVQRRLERQWEELRIWYTGQQDARSDIDVLKTKTEEAIEMIMRYATRLSNTGGQAQSRLDDYRNLAIKFNQTENIEEAHRLFASVFGVEQSRSLIGESTFVATADNTYVNAVQVWEAAFLEPVETRFFGIRSGARKKKINAIANSNQLKKERMEERLIERKNEEAMIRSMIVDKKMVFRDFHILQPFQRKILLKWLKRTSRQVLFKEKDVILLKTDIGMKFSIRKLSNDRVSVRCTDGVMMMPDLEFTYEGEVS